MSHNLNIAVIPDTHFPYADESKVQQAIEYIKKAKPDVVIQIGDLYDQLSFSKYSKDPSKTSYSPREEAQIGYEQAAGMWDELSGFERYQLPGNHDVRVIKRMQDKLPEASFIADDFFKQQMTFKGVKLVDDEFILDDIMFMHGFRKAGDHARWNQMSTVTGHTHKANISYYENRYGMFFQMNCGWLGDKNKYPFSYRRQRTITGTNTGIGLIEKGQPRFIKL